MKKIIIPLIILTIIALVYSAKKTNLSYSLKNYVEKSIKNRFPHLEIKTSNVRSSKINNLENYQIDNINIKYYEQIFNINNIDISLTDNFFLGYFFPFFFKKSSHQILFSFNLNIDDLNAKFKCKDDLVNLKCEIEGNADELIILNKITNKNIKISKLKINSIFNMQIKNRLEITEFKTSSLIEKITINDKTILSKTLNIENINFQTNLLDKDLKIELLSFINGSSLLLKSNINDFALLKQIQKFSTYIFVENTQIKNLEKLWFLGLGKQKILLWIKKHISHNGEIKNANIEMDFVRHLNNFSLNNLDANFDIENADIQYSKNFPTVKNIKAKAYFTKKNMNIILSEGKLLESNIDSGKISIPKFSNRYCALIIDLKTIGPTEDLLKHISYKNPFNKKINKLYNGFSDSNILIKLNLSKNKITLKNSAIAIKSEILASNTNIIEGDSNFNLENKIGMDEFKISLETKESIKPFSIIYKENNIKNLSFSLLTKNDKVFLKKIKTNDENFNADVIFDVENKYLEELNITNKEFTFNKTLNNNKSSILLRTPYFNPEPLTNIINDQTNNQEVSKLDIDIKIAEILIENKIINDFSIKLICNMASCSDGEMKFNNNNKNSLKLNIKNNPEEKNSQISGSLEDLSLVSSLIDTELKIDKGSVDISAILSYDNGYILNGEINENSNIIFKDDANKEEYKFKKLHIIFSLKNWLLVIKKALISNNKVGISSKGNINLTNYAVDLSGSYTPAYILNKQFLQNIPIVTQILHGSDKGGLFAIKYKYYKKDKNSEGVLTKNPLSLITPGILRNLIFWE